jgi:hypothetical protein
MKIISESLNFACELQLTSRRIYTLCLFEYKMYARIIKYRLSVDWSFSKSITAHVRQSGIKAYNLLESKSRRTLSKWFASTYPTLSSRPAMCDAGRSAARSFS